MKTFKQYFNESTDVIPHKVGHILLSDYVKGHIATHNEIGIGSVFSRDINMELIQQAASSANVEGDGGAYTVTVPGIGYNLVLPIERALELPEAVQTTATKDERGQPIQVPAVKTSAGLEQFATDQLTIIIRPSNPDYLPEDVKGDENVLQAIANNRSYSILTAFPGDPDIPPASEWSERYAVIIPS
jgi:hypothetical protein